MFQLIVCLLLTTLTEAKFYKTNITDFTKCEVYYSRSGTVYKDFFEFTDHHPQNGSLLDFHFSVIASSDAHILLAPSSNVEKGDPVYEIVIGAGGNTFCDIRRNQKSGVKATIRIKGLLSGLDVSSFWIHLSKDGVIDVGKEGQELGFLSWVDPDPLPLKVFSFSTWPGVEAKWFFDCPRDENNTSHSKQIKRPMTPIEKLRQDLLFYYDPFVRPVQNHSNITVVGLKLSTKIINLDEHKSQLQYTGSVTLTWKDDKMKWNPGNYSNISTLHIFRREIWIPDLFLFNAVSDDNNLLEDTMLMVNSTGHVNWTTTIKIKSWCSPDDLGNWPRDVHTCDITLGFYRDFTNLQLIYNSKDSSFSCPFSSTWAILEVESFSNKGWANDTNRNTKNFDPPALNLHLKMKRTSKSYTVIFFSPFIFIAISLLTTFWVSPFSHLKISLACSQLVLASFVLIALGVIIPIHSKLVPNIVLLYSYSLVATVFCILIEIIVINISRNNHEATLPLVLTKILLSMFLKMFLCLPDVDFSKQYGNLNDRKLDKNHQTMWILLGVVIDRVSFFLYLGLVIYAFCITY